MNRINGLWQLQLIEGMKEASRLHERFKIAPQPNVEDLDQAMAISEKYCQAYDLKEITFDAFIEFGNSLRARQAHKVSHKADNHE